jgi:hypothetical protein
MGVNAAEETTIPVASPCNSKESAAPFAGWAYSWAFIIHSIEYSTIIEENTVIVNTFIMEDF